MFCACHAVLSVLCSLVAPAGRELTSWLFCVWCLLVFLSLSHVVSWVRRGTWLYWFLICAFFLTFTAILSDNIDRRGLSPPVKYVTVRSKVVLLLWIFYGFFLSCVCYAFVCFCLFVPCGHLLEMGWPLGSRLWSMTVSLSFSDWYPGSSVVLDCIDSWSLHPYLLWLITPKIFLIFVHFIKYSDLAYVLPRKWR